MGDQMTGRVALVTGGSRGIGRAIAAALGNRGAKVAINWVSNESAAEQALDEVRAAGGECGIFQADVASEEEVSSLVAAVESDLGPIDMLVTSAGIMEAGGAENLNLESFREVMRVNVEGTFLPVMAVKDGMMTRGRGSIVCISSIAGLRSRPRVIAYSTSKAAVIGFVRSCAGAFGPNVRVNGIAPGLIRTDMTESMEPDVLEGMKQEAFVKRLGVPEDISGAAVFLLSDEAAFVSGQTFVVDGGRVTLP
jgi:3-oxoacyl-[acyl-carrier protein] reductase|tara:strand:+ start:493 stop:1245 length:753 start_codon:yes stop_codon:yes gene_type:complete